MPTPSSATSVGAGGRPSSGGPSSKSSVVRRGKSGGSSSTVSRSKPGGGNAGMWRFYTEDSPGLQVGPVPVLVMSLVFIASVFMLHIWGKWTRS
ncbi:protein transport protein Sec61 subunit beta-like [Bolinopsis microptera]|uniref:protein transport protein Sec61 subunit beta-like n=1 Tax=Bolinopsis microptera TaxID=2820187 RepID=UPI003078FE0A